MGQLAIARNNQADPIARQTALDGLAATMDQIQLQPVIQPSQAWRDMGLDDSAGSLDQQRDAALAAEDVGRQWQDLGIEQPVDALSAQKAAFEAGETAAPESEALYDQPAGVTSQTPDEPRKVVVAPKVEIPAAQDGETATAQVRQRMAQHQAMARDGFTQVEKKDDGSFWLVNPTRNEEHKLAGLADARGAEWVIGKTQATAQETRANTGAAVPKAAGAMDVAPVAPSRIPIRDIMESHTDARRTTNGVKASAEINGTIREALDAGSAVTLYAEGKPRKIVDVLRGKMADDKGQLWGALPLMTDPDGARGWYVEVVQKAAGPVIGTTPEAARKRVEAPQVATPRQKKDGPLQSTQVLRRLAQHEALARDGFTQVEKKGDGSYWLVNPERGEEFRLAGPVDAHAARRAIAAATVNTPALESSAPPGAGIEDAQDARKVVAPPRVPTPPATKDSESIPAKVRQRKAQLTVMAEMGFTQVERKDDGGFSMVAPERNEEMRLDSAGDAQRARAAVAALPNAWVKSPAVTPLHSPTIQVSQESKYGGRGSEVAQDAAEALANRDPGQRNSGLPEDAGLQANRSDGSWLRDDQNLELGNPPGSQSPARDAVAETGKIEGLRQALKRGRPNVTINEVTEDDPRRMALNPLLDLFGSQFGKRGIVVEMLGKDADDGVATGGDYFVNVDTKGIVQPIAATLAHEFGHTKESGPLRFEAPGLAALHQRMWEQIPGQAREAYFQYLQRAGQTQGRDYLSATREDLIKVKSEMLKDFMGKRLTDKDWLRRLGREKPALFGDFVRDWIKLLDNLIEKFRGAINAMGGRGSAVKDVDLLMRRHLKELEEMKSIAIDVAAEWAVKRPGLAQKSGVDAVLKSARDPQTSAQLSWEAKPGLSTGLLPGMSVTGAGQAQREYLMDIQYALGTGRQADTPQMLGWGGRYSEKMGGGGWRGITGYSIQSTLQLPAGEVDVRTKSEIEFFLATRGMVLAQEGMGWHAPRYGQQGLGLEINLGGKKLDAEQFEELYAAVRHELKDYSVPPIPSADGVRFLNFTGLEQSKFEGKVKLALAKTSIHNIWREANGKNHTGRAEEASRGVGRGNGPLRPGSPDLPGGRDHDGTAFSAEGIRTFDFDGDLIENDWSRGEGQYRERALAAWQELKDLPGQHLPQTREALDAYLADMQQRVDKVNAKYAGRFSWGKPSLTPSERATGVGATYEYPASRIEGERAARAYFRNPDGTLETLYHGTASVINEVAGGVGPATKTGAVFYATSAPLYAEERALAAAKSKAKWRDKNIGANIIPVSILSSNPFDWRIQVHRDTVLPAMKAIPKGFSAESIEELVRDGDWRAIELKEVLQAVKDAGFDSFLIRDDPSQPGNIGIGAFHADDVVFAISEAGSVVQRSARDIVGRTHRTYTPEQLAAFARVGFEVELPSLKERAKELWKDAGKKLAQGLVDQFAPVKELSKDAYSLLRLAKGSSGAFESLLKGGRLKLSDNVYDFDEAHRGGVIDRLLMPMQGEHHDFLRWVAANRAERLAGEGKENLFSTEDIRAIKTLRDGNLAFDYTLKHGPQAGRTTRKRAEMYDDSLKTFNEFNTNVLDMASQSRLIDEESRHLWEHEFYVPFYRVSEENGFAGVNIKGGAVRRQAFKKLKGGTDALNADLLDNTLMNWAHLLDAAAKNRAAKATLEAAEDAGIAIEADEETAREMGKATDNRDGAVWFMDRGVQRYFLVDDHHILTAITSLEYAGMKNPIMSAMGFAKHALTVGVTASPFFKIRNLIRDSIQVIGTGEISYNPAKNLAQGWKLTDPKNDIYFRLLAGGGTIHFGTMLESSEARRVQALVESGVDPANILDGEHKVKAFYRRWIEPGITAYNELGNRGEAINRAALYDQLVKQGVSHAEASLQARDLMDFSMQGSFATVRFLTMVVPFLNARLQGAYKLGKAAKENPKRMALVTGAVAMASLSLLAAFGDDDDWKKREEWDRNGFWWFKFGGTAFRIPKPFEIGAIGTLAERSAEALFDDEMTAERFRTQILTLLGDNLSMNPVPQLVKPMLDIYANKDSLTGRPIETMGMSRLQSEYRFTGNTSMTARAASTALNAVTGVVGKEALSPVQVDALIRGYFGWLGTFVVGLADMPARYATDQAERPSIDLWKAATGGMISGLDDAPSRYVTQVYEQARVIEQAYGTWRSLRKAGKTEEAAEFMEDNGDKIKRYRSVEAVKVAIARINQQIRVVEIRDMDADAKRLEIRRLNARKDWFARRLAA